MRAFDEVGAAYFVPSRLSPQPFTLSPQPFALSQQPFALSPQPFALSLQPFTLSPQPFTLSPQPFTLSPQPFALSLSKRSAGLRQAQPERGVEVQTGLSSASPPTTALRHHRHRHRHRHRHHGRGIQRPMLRLSAHRMTGACPRRPSSACCRC